MKLEESKSVVGQAIQAPIQTFSILHRSLTHIHYQRRRDNSQRSRVARYCMRKYFCRGLESCQFEAAGRNRLRSRGRPGRDPAWPGLQWRSSSGWQAWQATVVVQGPEGPGP